MASPAAVRQYLSCWWQLGKSVIDHSPQGTFPLVPALLLTPEGMSVHFESLCDQILEEPERYHLSGTDETIADLLSERWELLPCARCQLPIPIKCIGPQQSPCPCSDSAIWPNPATLPPRLISSHGLRQRITAIGDRIGAHGNT
ncbi:MAG: hypothetical protein OHK0012_02530 [Synechococcales cyanobacterium]